MARELNTGHLDRWSEFASAEFLRPSRWSKSNGKLAIGGRDWILQTLWLCPFKDEHAYMVAQVKEWMGQKTLDLFEKAAKDKFGPRDDALHAELLRKYHAVDPNGKHVEGAIGSIELARSRVVSRKAVLVRRPICKPVDPENPGGEWEIVRYIESTAIRAEHWPIYAGETEERIEGRVKSRIGAPGPGADPFPPGVEPMAVGANITNISEEACRAALDTMTARLDEGSTAGEIRGRVGAQPTDPDNTETGTLLFTLPLTTPTVIASAVDDTDGSCSATFGTITDDTSAAAGGTLGYCRFAATGSGADDHIDGNATTDASGATDWNTLEIAISSTVSMTSAVLGMSQGSTAD